MGGAEKKKKKDFPLPVSVTELVISWFLEDKKVEFINISSVPYIGFGNIASFPQLKPGSALHL